MLGTFTLMIGFAVQGSGTSALGDYESRISVTNALQQMRVQDLNDLNVYSGTYRLDGSDTQFGRTTTYVGLFKIHDNQDPQSEMLQSEYRLWRNNVLLQRVVADGRRVWTYDPRQNEYSVSNYDFETGNVRSTRYRRDYQTQLKQVLGGPSLNIFTLIEQIGLYGQPALKDWIGGLRFEGQQDIDPADALGNHITRVIWQATPSRDRYTQFNMESFDRGGSWIMNAVYVHRESGGRISDYTLTLEKDQSGIPVAVPANSAELFFHPPAGAKAISSPRTIKF